MASRSKSDLYEYLEEAYIYASSEWAKRYPGEPLPFLTCTFRSNEEQNSLYAVGRTVKGRKVTNARAGQSPHNFLKSLAFDIAFIRPDRKLDWSTDLFKKFYQIIIEKYPEVEWGGSWKFKDYPHFEMKNWRSFLT